MLFRSGGLGALGLLFAKQLTSSGAKHLVLLSRSSPKPEVEEQLNELRSSGCDVKAIQCDVSKKEDVETMLTSVRETMPPIRGILHSAGVLDDATIENQSIERFEKVFLPKVSGAWNLHECTLAMGIELDFFVFFSSIASLLGSPGQSNYAAANAALDGLAHYRRSLGLAGVSIQWGAWTAAGMAAERDTVKRLEAQGISGIDNDLGCNALGSILAMGKEGPSQVAVLPINWDRFFSTMGGLCPPFLEVVKGKLLVNDIQRE